MKTAQRNWGYNVSQVLTYNYDYNNRLESVISSSSAEPDKIFTYYPSGKRESYSIGTDYSVNYTYDYRGRIKTITDNKDGEVFTYDYG